MFAMLKDPKDRAPSKMTGEQHPSIQTVSREMAGSIVMQNPGCSRSSSAADASDRHRRLQPQPGQFSYAISGVDPQGGLRDRRKLMGAFVMQGAGKYFLPIMQGGVSNDMFLQTPQLKIDILRDQAASYWHLADAHRDAAAQRVQPELRLPDQAADESVPGDPRSRRPARARAAGSRPAVHQVRRRRATVPLSAVASWSPTLGPQSVNHLNQFTSVTFSST
jgi:multidrug efflux pump subunit AcrB